MNYCRNCGMKIEPTYRICPSCGNALTQPIYQGIPTSKKTTGKDVTSFIFNIIAFYFAFVVYISMDELVLDCIANVERINMAYAIGALLWQIVFGGAAMLLSFLSRKVKPTGFNTANIILASLNIALVIIEFAIFLSYKV